MVYLCFCCSGYDIGIVAAEYNTSCSRGLIAAIPIIESSPRQRLYRRRCLLLKFMSTTLYSSFKKRRKELHYGGVSRIKRYRVSARVNLHHDQSK